MTIIRNLSASPIVLDDLGGITVEALSDYNLSEESQNDIVNSQDLNDVIINGDIVFIDAQGNQLTQQESLNTLNSISSTFPGFVVNINGAAAGTFSDINFNENVAATSPATSADIDFLSTVDIFKTVINGQELLTFNDPNRANKTLSIEKVPFLFVLPTVSSGSYLKIAQQTTNTAEGYLMPMDGTIVGLSSHIRSANGKTGYYRLYIDNVSVSPTLITYNGDDHGDGINQAVDNTLDYDINAGQLLQFRCESISGGGMRRNQYDINVVLYVRWRG